MSRLPPPTTFSEGLRLLFAVAAIVAGLCFGLGAIFITVVLVWGGWPEKLFGQIVEILGMGLLGALVLIGITQVGMLLGGPVGRIKGKASRAGVDLEASSHDDTSNSSTSAEVSIVTSTSTKTEEK